MLLAGEGIFANGAATAAFASLVSSAAQSGKRYLGNKSDGNRSFVAGESRTEGELRDAVNVLKTNEDFAALEQAAIDKHGQVTYRWDANESSSLDGVISINEGYDQLSYDVLDFDYPDNVWGAEAVGAFERSFDVNSRYPGIQRPFSLQRVLVHETIHGTLRPFHSESAVINQTNNFMRQHFNEPSRANDALRPIDRR